MRSALVRHPFVPFAPFDPFDLAVTRNPKPCLLAKPGCAPQAICCREAECGSPFLDYVSPPVQAAAAKMAAFPVSVSRRQNSCARALTGKAAVPAARRRDAAATSATTGALAPQSVNQTMPINFKF